MCYFIRGTQRGVLKTSIRHGHLLFFFKGTVRCSLAQQEGERFTLGNKDDDNSPKVVRRIALISPFFPLHLDEMFFSYQAHPARHAGSG